MKSMRSFMLAMAAAILLAGLPAAAQNTPARVVIANPSRIFTDIQESKDWQAKIRNDLAALEQEQKSRELKLQTAQSDRDQLKPDSQQWGERNEEFTKLMIEHEVWKRTESLKLERVQKTQMKVIFDKITGTIAEIAQQKGIDLVIAEIRPDLPENLDQIQVQDLRNRLASRNVLFSAGTVDISNDVIAAMDAKYKTGGQ